jgi:hypothetical protein
MDTSGCDQLSTRGTMTYMKVRGSTTSHSCVGKETKQAGFKLVSMPEILLLMGARSCVFEVACIYEGSFRDTDDGRAVSRCLRPTEARQAPLSGLRKQKRDRVISTLGGMASSTAS